jgi:hypothetical protein
MTPMVFASTKHVYLDDVEKRDKVAGANHPETAMLGHSA